MGQKIKEKNLNRVWTDTKGLLFCICGSGQEFVCDCCNSSVLVSEQYTDRAKDENYHLLCKDCAEKSVIQSCKVTK